MNAYKLSSLTQITLQLYKRGLKTTKRTIIVSFLAPWQCCEEKGTMTGLRPGRKKGFL